MLISEVGILATWSVLGKNRNLAGGDGDAYYIIPRIRTLWGLSSLYDGWTIILTCGWTTTLTCKGSLRRFFTAFHGQDLTKLFYSEYAGTG